MLYRKVGNRIEQHLRSSSDKIMIVEGARQVGKTFIIREIGQRLFKNYIELNFIEDAAGPRLFENVSTVADFYLQVSMIAGDKMGSKEDTLIFLDEIQNYPQLLTLLKFLREDGRFTYIASGSLLGITLRKTTSIPIGSIERLQMYPLDFEEFLIANGFNPQAIETLNTKYISKQSLDENTHERMLDLFRKYLLVVGMPDAVNTFLDTSNIVAVRALQKDIRDLYIADAVKYTEDSGRRLRTTKIYNLIPSLMANKKKRVVVKDIDEKKGAKYKDYFDEFEYLVASGIALAVDAVSTPVFPLLESSGKNLLKLYLNDVGLLTGILYQNNIRAVLDDTVGVNLGAVYETAVAQELAAHGHPLYYYDNKHNGEVDFLIDDYQELSTLPIEVKSGKDYSVHSALSRFVSNDDYHVKRGVVLSNSREICEKNGIVYMPVYYVMFM